MFTELEVEHQLLEHTPYGFVKMELHVLNLEKQDGGLRSFTQQIFFRLKAADNKHLGQQAS